MKLDHINIKAPCVLLEQEKDFFCEVLGLSVGNRPDFSSQGYWLYSGAEAIVHLSVSDSHCHNEKQGFFDHVAFQADDLSGLTQALEARGVKYSTAVVAETKTTQVFFRSPTQTRIEVNCITN